jgi:hypothetical protein
MTRQIEERIEEKTVSTMLANPPPPKPERPEAQLFQTIDDLHVRHGNLPATKDRIYLWGGGLLAGGLLFGVLYLMILFLE